MKTSIFIILLAASTMLGVAQETTPVYKNEVRLNFIQLFRNTFQVDYERAITEKSSLVISGGLIYKKTDNLDVLGGVGEVQYRINRIYISKNEKNERKLTVYAGPFTKFKYHEDEYNHFVWVTQGNYVPSLKTDYYSTLSVGGLVGLKFSLLKYIFIDMNFGGCVKFSETNAGRSENIFQDSYSGIAPAGNISFGVK